jgi:transcriptional regulator with XRE-family HTH domain
MPRTRSPIDKQVGSRVRIRRLTLKMSQMKLADALGMSFQQVQKYEKGINRIGAGRLQHIAQILQVPATFFFEDMPALAGVWDKSATASPEAFMDFIATSEELALAKAFMRIRNMQIRHRIVALVEEIVG